MTIHRNEAQWNRLLDHFRTGWRGAAWDCRSIGISDSSFKRLVHQYRKAWGEDFILGKWADNKKFSGRHMEYWQNPDRTPTTDESRRMFEQLTMQL